MILETPREVISRVLSGAAWTETTAEALASSAHVIVYEKGSTIFHAGEPADLLYVLLSGEAKLYFGQASGERILADIVPARQLLGHFQPSHGAQGEPQQRFSAEALSRCTVALITRGRVAAAAETLSAADLSRIAGHLADEWARLSERAFNFLMLDVRGRLAMAIDNLAERFGIPDGRGTLLPLRLSHEDFGELIGASRPMVSRHLKRLADAGVFYKHAGRYVLARRELSSGEDDRLPLAAVSKRGERPAPPREWRSARRLQAVPERCHAVGALRKVAR